MRLNNGEKENPLCRGSGQKRIKKEPKNFLSDQFLKEKKKGKNKNKN